MVWLLLFSLLLAPRLEDPGDKSAFRLWFTYLAEAQYYVDPAQRPKDIHDCSSLVRYAYREAFLKRDSGWMARNHLPVIPALPPIQSRSAPLFTTPAGLRHFADAKTLMRENCVRVGDSIDRARPGDLLFYEQISEPGNWHVMIYLGTSQLEPGSERFVVYHTGPVGRSPGELRKLRIDELLRHQQPRWRPVPGNGSFKGVFRWKFLEG